jgi:type I restriction-modification system DNA methylase subunit
MSTYSQAKTEVERLVERFAGLTARNRKHYNEAATRQEFILPLFRALGWIVEDTREVSPEEQVSRGFVDFAFRLGGIPRFFLETKKIPADLDDPRWAQQAINYAWLKGVTWAVLTDFEGLKVFNAEWQESIPARAVFKDLDWRQYLDRFDDLWLLSRPAAEEGALDRAAEAVGRKAKKTPVSRLLFADLTEWRRELFRHLRPYNPLWSVAQIDEAVQRILDRLIFIRTCEDRGIEEARLLPMLRQWRDQGRKRDLVKQLNALFREFDAAYDSRLFASHLCEELTSEAAPYERVVEGLYQVPGGYGQYDFNAIDADVLGTIYEQYLGHRAQDPEGKQVVDKRAKRKAQGIYYTPQFVVRYIVGQTLGRYLQEHDYQPARQVKVLDMACGSGSFLIEAFDLLDRYLAGIRTPLSRFSAGPGVSGSPLPLGEGPGVRADMHDFARRMEVLSANLYGVDLDAQAVEIARLNLLLKAVNRRGLLPPLDNIRQGNSLIGGSPAELEAAFGPAWRDKHPFNWAEEFPSVMAQGGFDVIVGNPPYIRAERMAKDDRAYWQESGQFEVVYGRFDIFILFVERAIKLLREGGRVGFIVPYAVLSQNYGKELRKLILDTCCIECIVDLSEFKVFQEASVDTCILILRKEGDETARERNHVMVVRQDDYSAGINPNGVDSYLVPQVVFRETPYTSFRLELSEPVLHVIGKIDARSLKLGDLCYIITGAVLHDPRTGASKERLIRTRAAPGLKPYIEAKEVARYVPPLSDRFLDYDVPHDMHRPKFPELFENEKLMICRIASKVIATYDDQHLYTDHTLDLAVRKDRLQWVNQRGLKISNDEASFVRQYHLFYLLGLVNSRVATFYLQMILGMAIEINPETARQLPIRRINFDDPADVARHDRMGALVEDMLHLQAELAAAEAHKEDRRHDLARRVKRLDGEIDALVYELYGLTEEEIAVVEGHAGKVAG